MRAWRRLAGDFSQLQPLGGHLSEDEARLVIGRNPRQLQAMGSEIAYRSRLSIDWSAIRPPTEVACKGYARKRPEWGWIFNAAACHFPESVEPPAVALMRGCGDPVHFADE